MTGPAGTFENPTVTRILDAAAAVFAEEGFGGARVDAIAARAGVNKAMLYYHVGDKAELYAAVLSRNFAHARARLATAVAQPGTSTDRLRAVIAAIVSLVDELPAHPRIMLREIASGAANLPDTVVRQMLELLVMVRGVLEEGVRDGQLRPVDPLLTHLMILGTVTFMTATLPVRQRMGALGVPLRELDASGHLASYLADVLLHGIAAPGGLR